MDRTGELFTVIDVLRRHGGVTPSAIAQLAAIKPYSSSSSSASSFFFGTTQQAHTVSALTKESRALGKDIRGCQRRASRLSHLAARKGLFDDPAAEINELTLSIKADVKVLEANMQRFAVLVTEVVGSIAVTNNNPSSSSIPTTATLPQIHWAAVVDTLRTHLLDLTRTFQDALRLRSENLRDQASRRRQFAHSRWAPPTASSLPLDSPLFAAAAASATTTTTPSNQAEVGMPSSSSSGGGLPLNSIPSSPIASSSSSAATVPLRRRQQQQQHLTTTGNNGGFDPSVTNSSGRATTSSNMRAGPIASFGAVQLGALHDARARQAEMRGVESTIVELGSTFTHMAALVAEQGDTLARIDSDMDAALENAEKARGEIGQLYKRVAAHRGFIIRLLVLVAFIILLFGVFRP